MDEFSLEGHEYIELCNLLKTMGLCESGGLAKNVIAGGEVQVNGVVETRKRCKIKEDSIVEYLTSKIKVTK